jgi:hypothetical protein
MDFAAMRFRRLRFLFAVSGTHRARGVNEIAPDIRRDVKVGRANSA